MDSEHTLPSPQSRHWKRDYLWEDQPVLICHCSLPQFTGESRAERRMERYWRHVEDLLCRWLEDYHARCCVLAAEALERSRPLPSYSVLIDWKSAFQDERRLSLLWEIRTEDRNCRFPELWDTVTGTPLACRKLLPAKAKRRLRGRACLLTEEGILALGVEEDELIWTLQTQGAP